MRIIRAYPAASQQDQLSAGLGVTFQAFNPMVTAGSNAPPTQSVVGVATYATAGSVITGIKLRNATAAAGTSPTTARFGLADNTGKILALSGNVNAAASWPAGVCTFAFTSTFTLTYSGVYYPCFVVNGTWGTTQPSLANVTTGGASMMAADGSNPVLVFGWNSQTDLPSVGNSLTLNANNRAFWMGLY